jgi:hypothetical protein
MGDEARVVHRAAAASECGTPGTVCSLATSDLHLNRVRCGVRDRVEAHVNAEVDVVGVAMAGAGTLEVDGRVEALRAGGPLLRAHRGAAGDHCNERRPRLPDVPPSAGGPIRAQTGR